MRAFLAALVIGAGVLAGCGDDDDSLSTETSAGTADTLSGKTYIADQLVVDGVDRPAASGTEFRVDFDAGSVSARAGCNHLGGLYRLDGERLIVEAISMTEMACDEALMEQDGLMVELLENSPTVTVDGDRLVLATDRITFDGLDREVADPDRPLVGTVWAYAGLLDPTSASRGQLEATVTFRPDGTVAYAGCQSASGTYTLDGDRITITLDPPAGAPCADATGAGAEEQTVLMYLGGTHVVTIDAATARLVREDGAGIMLTELTG